jgi:AraC-like DNA-binding protein
VEQELSNHRSFRKSDFDRFGERFDIHFGYPDARDAVADDSPIARGEIIEQSLDSGFRFTFSDIEVLEAYESESLGHAPLLMLIVLEGRVVLKLGAVEQTLTPGTAVSMHLHPDYPLTALQPGQPRLRIVNLAFDPGAVRLGHVSPTLRHLNLQPQAPLITWEVPKALLALLNEYAYGSLQPAQQLLVLEGLALQLVGLGTPATDLPEQTEVQNNPGASAQAPILPLPQRQRLELVRQHLEFSPHQPHSLAELARIAAMSPSGLRAKFRAAYGMPVFDYLRKCRLNLARQHLQQGYSVQQAANKVGYNHASNFATAYRRAFGISPTSDAR